MSIRTHLSVTRVLHEMPKSGAAPGCAQGAEVRVKVHFSPLQSTLKPAKYRYCNTCYLNGIQGVTGSRLSVPANRQPFGELVRSQYQKEEAAPCRKPCRAFSFGPGTLWTKPACAPASSTADSAIRHRGPDQSDGRERLLPSGKVEDARERRGGPRSACPTSALLGGPRIVHPSPAEECRNQERVGKEGKWLRQWRQRGPRKDLDRHDRE